MLSAWGGRGLTTAAHCYEDACAEPATTAAYVDLYVSTPNCEAHSRRNHRRTDAEQKASLEDVWKSLAYVRRRRPRIALFENVTDASVAGPLTGLLARLEGYKLETGGLEPRDAAKALCKWLLALRRNRVLPVLVDVSLRGASAGLCDLGERPEVILERFVHSSHTAQPGQHRVGLVLRVAHDPTHNIKAPIRNESSAAFCASAPIPRLAATSVRRGDVPIDAHHSIQNRQYERSCPAVESGVR